MPNNTVPSSQSLKIYLQVKKLQIFVALKRMGFSGKLTWSTAQDRQWILFFNQGQVVYGTGGLHPIRQWYRQVQSYLPEAELSYGVLQKKVATYHAPILPNCWEYNLLLDWLNQGKLSLQHFQTICQNIVADILFDVVQTDQVQYHLARQPPFNPAHVPGKIAETELLRSITDLWQAWLEADLGPYSPNSAPIINHPDPIQAQVSPQVFQSLIQLLDGQRSLRDLAAKLGQDVLLLTQALQPYIKANWISLVEVGDFPSLITLGESALVGSSQRYAPQIVCIDDSPMVCKAMGQVIRAAGYDYLSITEGSKAIPTLLAKQPDLVFLDLVMPDTNGYEICSNLRKITRFKEIPIVILSGNDGLVDQVRARLLGATDFLSKPMEPIVILSVIRKHLGHLAQV